MALTDTWNEATPAGSDFKSDGDNKIRQLKQQMREAWQVDHTFPDTGSAGDSTLGYHKVIHIKDNGGAASAVTDVIGLYNNGDALYMIKEGGGITEIAGDSVNAKTGDWIASTVTTARTGWTNVSATYTGKFMRISATPLSTGGSDTHSHAAGTYISDPHTHSYTPNTLTEAGGGGSQTYADNTAATTSSGGGGAITGTSASGDNVPVYVQVVIFQKD